MVLINPDKFKAVIHECMLSTGVEVEVANTVSESLIETSLRGVDSHGVHLFPHYYKELELGRLNKTSKVIVQQKGSSVAMLDAKNTFGHLAGKYAMLEAIQLAKNTGVGIVSVKNSTHFGAAWYFTDIAAKHKMIGIALTNTEALVNVYNSKKAFFGTNPICFSAPMQDEEPYCLDMATSTIPWNKIKNYRRQDKSLETGWAFDSEGQPTDDPHKATSLSSVGGYKGFGLGMLIEILCSGLTSGPMSSEIAPLYDTTIADNRNISHFFLVLDISKFVSIDRFQSYMSTMVNQIRTLPKSGEEEVMVAGDKEKLSYKHRKLNGIPMEDSMFLEFLSISNKFNQTIL